MNTALRKLPPDLDPEATLGMIADSMEAAEELRKTLGSRGDRMGIVAVARNTTTDDEDMSDEPWIYVLMPRKAVDILVRAES